MRRDYNIECKDNQERKYAYHFDLDVMHPYMVQAFTPFLKKGNALELGCFQGAFTARIANLFDTVTCVEASGEAIHAARQRLRAFSHISFVQSRFEDACLSGTYDTVFLTHVLEHIDDRVGLLKKIREEWLGAWSIARCMPECKRAFQTDCGKDGTDRFERGRNRSRT